MQGSVPPSISVTDLACRRGDRVLFKGLSFELAAGDALHIKGANGTGKSSLIRILAGFLSPFSGGVRVSGGVGLLDERTGLDPDQTLGEALRFWQRIDHCTSPDGAIKVLGLEPLLDIPVRYLSTGQRKRAAMAALLNRAVPIWLLDEPLSGLDTEAIGKVNSLVQLHVSGGGIAVIASHQELAIEGLSSLVIEDFVPHREGAE